MDNADACAVSGWQAPAALTIYDVAELPMAPVLAALTPDAAELDLAALEELDAAGAQWLLLVQRRLARPVTLSGASEPLLRRLERLGVAAALGLSVPGEPYE